MYVGKCEIVQLVKLEATSKSKMLHTVIYVCYITKGNSQLQNVTLTLSNATVKLKPLPKR